jgi:hypothetical protein
MRSSKSSCATSASSSAVRRPSVLSFSISRIAMIDRAPESACSGVVPRQLLPGEAADRPGGQSQQEMGEVRRAFGVPGRGRARPPSLRPRPPALRLGLGGRRRADGPRGEVSPVADGEGLLALAHQRSRALSRPVLRRSAAPGS